VPDWLYALFERYGYTVVFVGVFLENTGLPVPGETALLAGAILGDNLGFLIGRRAGRGLAERYGGRIGLTPARLAHFDRFFRTHGGRTVFLARFITGLRVFGAMLAGASGLPWPSFLFYNATGAVVWATLVALAGYSLAYSWDTLERWIGRSGLIGLALVAAIVVITYLRRRRADQAR
jgi:membrane protein DedA with SNARE-associated domain